MGLAIVIDGQVKKRKSGTGDRGMYRRAEVVFGEGVIDVTFDTQEAFDKFPAEGQPVKLLYSGRLAEGKFGKEIRKITFERVLEGAAEGSPTMRRAA